MLGSPTSCSSAPSKSVVRIREMSVFMDPALGKGFYPWMYVRVFVQWWACRTRPIPDGCHCQSGWRISGVLHQWIVGTG